MTFDVSAVRKQFPILGKTVAVHPLIYLDNAATTQKPTQMLDRMLKFYLEQNANVHRSFHALAEEATLAYDEARKRVADFIGAKFAHEIVFTKNATEALNLVAKTWGQKSLKPGDAVALTLMEHHSNIVPWLQLKESHGINIEWIPVDREGNLDLNSIERILKPKKVKLLSVTGLSNVLGCLPPIAELASIAHSAGAKILIDAAQLVGHRTIDVKKIDADFLVFSGHKIYGPSGIGVLYGKEELLKSMPPFLGGGDMIQSVTTEGFTCAELPRKFEAGTPPVPEAVGLGEAIIWFKKTGTVKVHAYMHDLIKYAYRRLKTVKDLTILGPKDPEKRAGSVSFTVKDIHPHDLTDILGEKGICLRAGHHCTQPLHKLLGINASTRLSVAVYNTKAEIDVCVDAIEQTIRLLHK